VPGKKILPCKQTLCKQKASKVKVKTTKKRVHLPNLKETFDCEKVVEKTGSPFVSPEFTASISREKSIFFRSNSS